MLDRCFNKNRRSFRAYGARGISVCSEWMKFDNFLKDMGEGKKGWTLERLNNDLGYSPENCCWATYAAQSRNTRRTLIVTVNGKTGCVKDVCRHLNLSYRMVMTRLHRGWTVAAAFLTPPKINRH